MDDRSLSDMLEDGGEVRDWWTEMVGLEGEEEVGHQAIGKQSGHCKTRQRKAGGFNKSRIKFSFKLDFLCQALVVKCLCQSRRKTDGKKKGGRWERETCERLKVGSGFRRV